MSHKQDLLDPEANMNENLSQEDQELLKETLTDDDMEHVEEEVKVEVDSKPKPSSRRRRKKSSAPISATSSSTTASTVVMEEDSSNDVSSISSSGNIEDDIPEEQEEKVKISTPFVFGVSEEEDSNKEDAAYDKTSEMLQQMEELRLFDEEQEVEDYLNSPNDEEEESLEESARSAFDGLF